MIALIKIRVLDMVLRAVALSLLAAAPVMAAPERIVLQDHLDLNWTAEPVSYPFEAPQGACHPGSLQLVGPLGPVPVQLGQIEYWPDSPFVKSARLWFVADLAPLARDTYQVSFGPAAGVSPASAADLQVQVAANEVTITTAQAGMRAVLGRETFQPAMPAEQVPGPIAALRLADGAWFAGSTMQGPTRIVSREVELIGRGPVFGQVRYRYQYEDGNELEGTATLFDRSDRVVLTTHSREDRPEDGFRLEVSRDLPPLVLHLQRLTSVTERDPEVPIGEWGTIELQDEPAGHVADLSPWGDWFWATSMPTLRLGFAANREIHITRREPGRWVEPAKPEAILDWGRWHHKRAGLHANGDGGAYLLLNNAQGQRHLEVGESKPTEQVGWRPRRDTRGRRHGSQTVPERLRLDRVKDYVLDWTASEQRHPRLFMSRSEVEARWAADAAEPPARNQALIERARILRRSTPTPNYHINAAVAAYLASGGDAAIARELRLVEGLEWQLGLLGDFDKMRQTEQVAAQYDVLIDSGLIPEDRRSVIRARMALLGYLLADPATWSAQRGYRSYNMNMTVSYTQALGTVACLLRDHPMASQWIEQAAQMTRRFLQQATVYGEWFESMHYAQVSVGDLLSFAIAAKQAGHADFFADPVLQKLGLYLAQQYTPHDPRHQNRRVTPPFGRGTAGMAWGHFGVLAKGLRDVDPELSAQMQWLWQQTNHATGMIKIGGFQDFYPDRSLPAQRPTWGSARFPHTAILLRHGLGHPQEHYVNFVGVAEDRHTVRPQEVGSVIAWFAFGQPISMAFANPEDYRMQRLMNQVTPAGPLRLDSPEADETTQTTDSRIVQGLSRGTRRTTAEHVAFTTYPQADYAHTRYTLDQSKTRDRVWRLADLPDWPQAGEADGPIHWQRQLLFVRDVADPRQPHYLVLNDTITNDQPTRWHFWSLSEVLDTPDRVAAALAHKPGLTPAAARELLGDRFTAIGQYGVDLEYFIASPRDTPRHTLRYGGTQRAYEVDVVEYQDLLHLQLPGAGRYYAVLFPRAHDQSAPAFERLADDRILCVTHAAGVDYVQLAQQAEPVGDAASGIGFETTAGLVRRDDVGETLLLAAPGRVTSGSVSLWADGSAELRRVGDRWTLCVVLGDVIQPHPLAEAGTNLRSQSPSMETPQPVRIELTGDLVDTWSLPQTQPGVEVRREAGRLVLTVTRTIHDLPLNP